MTKFSLCPSPLGHNESNTLTQNRCGGCFVVVVVFYIFIRTPVLWVVRCMYCTLPLAAKHRHIILHCICLVKLIEHMLIWVQLK